LDEQFARMLQQEMLAELERESQSSSYHGTSSLVLGAVHPFTCI
jgi:hypothetical protein